MPDRSNKALVAGWFSYVNGHATAGDLFARDVLCEWLDSVGMRHVTAFAPPFTGGPMLEDVNPAEFSHAFFVCGPFERREMEGEFLNRFCHCRLIGLNLSIELDRNEREPFDFLIERDSNRHVNPDLVFGSRNPTPPIIGVCLVEPNAHVDVNTADFAITSLLDRWEAARVPIDTRLDVNSTGLRTRGEIEALISRVDAIVTTRLHGLVLALKNGVPALVVDAVPGGGKVSRQCLRVGWPNFLHLNELREDRLDLALEFALSQPARALARRCSADAAADVEGIRAKFAAELSERGVIEKRFAERQSRRNLDESASWFPRASEAPITSAERVRRRLARAFRKLS